MILLVACAEEEELGLDIFYDSYKIDKIEITVDRDIFFEGDDPVVFSARAIDRTENPVELFDFKLVVNNTDTLPDKTFIPTESGQYTIRAVANELESNIVRIWYVLESDIRELNLSYEGYTNLTTNPWSVVGDFSLFTKINGIPVDVTKSAIPFVVSDGSQTIQRDGLSFSTPGTKTVRASFNGVESESIVFNVREEKDYEIVTLPIVYHYINKTPNESEIQRAIDSYNRIFNNQNIRLNDNELVNQWENPNWVDARLNFVLAETDPDGNALPFLGSRVINTMSTLESEQELLDVIRSNNWDPNKYINVYVTDDIFYEDATRPILDGENLQGLTSLNSENVTDSRNKLNFISNTNDPYNSNMLGKYLGLYQPGMCTEDYCDDTFSYSSTYRPFGGTGGVNDGGRYNIADDCSVASVNNPTVFYIKNIMDDQIRDVDIADPETGNLTAERIREVITFDQRERMRTVIDHAINRPTAKNQ